MNDANTTSRRVVQYSLDTQMSLPKVPYMLAANTARANVHGIVTMLTIGRSVIASPFPQLTISPTTCAHEI